MHKTIQILFLLLPLRLFAQSFRSELFGCDSYSCPYGHYGYPCEHRHTVSIFELPAKTNPAIMLPAAKSLAGDPLADRLAKRMEPILTATNFTKTNSVPFDMAPGLSPKTH